MGGPAPRHKDPLGDLWIGHMSVDPRKGKSRIDGVAATQTIVDKQAFQVTVFRDLFVIHDQASARSTEPFPGDPGVTLLIAPGRCPKGAQAVSHIV